MHSLNKLTLQVLAPAFAAFAASSAHAQFVTGFEAPVYTAGSTLVGIDDPAAPGTNPWISGYGTANAQMVTASANPYAGSQHLRINDNGASTAFSASLNLGSTFINPTAPITISFALAVGADVSDGTGAQAQVYFGSANANLSTAPYWFAVQYDDATSNGIKDGNLIIWTNSLSGSSAQGLNLGAYSTYSALGSYVKFDIQIDPVTLKYTSVGITGTTSGFVDKTASVLASVSGGAIPHLGTGAAGIPNYISLITGGNDTLTFDVDAISISQIPEPSACAALIGFAAFACVAVRRRRR